MNSQWDMNDRCISDNYRYERKFLISDYQSHHPIIWIKSHPALFSDLYTPRWINNIYLDTPQKNSYFDNIEGLSSREKIRIRWYGDLFGQISAPMLEFKIKQGELGYKKSYKLAPFNPDEHISNSTIKSLLEKSDLPSSIQKKMASRVPLLMNCYKRCYFQSLNKHFRITLDTEMAFIQIPEDHHSSPLLRKNIFGDAILEIKYDAKWSEDGPSISNHFPYRLSKNSKYITGLNLLKIPEYG